MDKRLHKQQEHPVIFLLRLLCRIGFLPYLYYVLWLTLLSREPTHRRCMLSPFWEYRYMLSGHSQWYYFWQIVGNLVMLLPLGFMLPMLSDFFRKAWRTIPLLCLCSAAIELVQWFTARGLMEFDDVFNNTLGGIVGFGLCCMLLRGFAPKN